MKKRIILIISLFSVIGMNGIAQDMLTFPARQFKISIINPGIEYEIPAHNNFTFVVNPGIGYGGSYRETTVYASGWLYLIAPYLDLQYRYYYNAKRRARKGKLAPNSANFISIKGLYRGPAIRTNFIRTTNNDYAISLNWGLQRVKQKLYYNFNIGPMYYMDLLGNGGPSINLEFNIGIIPGPRQ